MPVSTRSRITGEPQTEINREDRRTRHRLDQEENQLDTQLRNPHHGLKEKMKALTLLYEQQKKAAAALRNPSPKPEEKRFSTHPSVNLLDSGRKEERKVEKEQKDSNFPNVMRENTMPGAPAMPNSTVTRNFVLPFPPADDAKENHVMGPDRILGFSSRTAAASKTTVARKLSLGNVMPQTEPRLGVHMAKQVLEIEKFENASEKIGSSNRILVFVRLRPMAKKEKEAGSRCCIKIVNKRDVYLTEFANENDYLRLKRLRGRHFAFDASFPDSSSQQEVYSTS